MFQLLVYVCQASNGNYTLRVLQSAVMTATLWVQVLRMQLSASDKTMFAVLKPMFGQYDGIIVSLSVLVS